MAIIVSSNTGTSRTFLQLQEEALHDEFDSSKYRELVKRWLNEAAQKLAREIQLPTQLTRQDLVITAGASSVAIPAAVETIESVRRADGNRLREIDVEELRDFPASTRGVPQVFAVFGTTLEVWPTVAGEETLELAGHISVVDMVGDADLATVPTDYENLLIHFARARAFAMEDDVEMSNFEMGLYMAGLQDARKAIQRRTRNRVRQTPGMLERVSTPRFVRP